MKKFKKLLAFAMAMIMCLGMAVTASAEGTGTIKIENATDATIYQAYKLFDANPTTTQGGLIAYTTGAAQKAWFEAWGDENPFDFQATSDSAVYNVTQKESFDNKAVIDFLDSLYEYDESSKTYVFASVEVNGVTTSFTEVFGAGAAAKKAGNDVVFENIAYGYYLITSTAGATVTVSSTNPDATVIDKNTSEPHFPSDGGGKTIEVKDAAGVSSFVKENTVNYGDTVKFKVTINSSNYDGKDLITKYIITDTLDAGMSYVKAAEGKIVEIKVGDTTLTQVAGNPGEKEFSIKETTPAEGKTGFEIEIPWAAAEYDEDGNVKAETIQTYYGQDAVIEVTYEAKVTADVVSGTALKNAANFSYEKNGTTTTTPGKPEETTTTTYSFDLVKTNQTESGNPAILSGAEFSLYRTQDGTEAISLIKVDDDNYRVATPEEIAAGEDITTTIVAGNVKVSGLAGNHSYWLEETKAPAGYNKLTERKEVKIEKVNLDAEVDTANNTYLNDGVQVINVAGNLLPSTGGIGTTIFYVVGGLLVAGAGILLITKKRMSKEQ